MDAIPVPDRHHVILQFQSAVVVPGPPPGPGEPPTQALIPVGVIKVPTGYQLATEFRDELTEALSKVEPPPKPSGLIVAQGPGAEQGAKQFAEQAAQTERALKGQADKDK